MAASTSNLPADPILQTLHAHRDAFWRNHGHLSETERHQLWSKRRAELVSSLDDGLFPAPTPASPHGLQHTPALQIPQMDRSASNRSIQSAPASEHVSTTFTDPMAPVQAYPMSATGSYQGLLHSVGSQSMMSAWESSSQEPFTGLVINNDAVTPPMAFDPSLNYIAFSAPSSSNQLSVQTNAPYGWSSPYDASSGANTPTTGELTNRSTVASSDMSRQSSTVSTSLPGAFYHMNVDSSPNVFPFSDTVEGHEPLSAMSFSRSVGPSESNCSPFPMSRSDSYVGECSNSSAFFFSQQKPQAFAPELDLVEDMKRSVSSQSGSSNASTQSRASQRRQETLLSQSSRPIAPKEASHEAATMLRQASDQRMGGPMQDGSPKTVAAITKAPASKAYVRPRHPKILCPHCDKYPEGFRGEHELRRHVDSKHAKVRKVWICVDASENKNFLASCKQCRNKKQYGAYYNAAAHLRRAHFHPRKRGRKSRNDSEKRGGKGGGNDPPMDVLKKWMKEIEVLVSANPAEDDSSENDTDGPALAPVSQGASMSMVSPEAMSTMFASTAAPPQAIGVTAPFAGPAPSYTLYEGFETYAPGVAQPTMSYGFQPSVHPTADYSPVTVDFDGQQQFSPGQFEPFPMDMPQ